MKAFWIAITFLTRIPMGRLIGSDTAAVYWKNSASFYPLVGLVIGGLLWVIALVLEGLFPLPVAAVLVLIFWVYLTGGLHVDGWIDLADGLGSQRTGDERLAIMKDSRVGAMGVQAAVLLFMLKAVSIYVLLGYGFAVWFILPAVAARFILVIAIRFWPYLTEKGMAGSLREGLTPFKIWLVFFFVVGTSFVLYGWAGFGILLAAITSGWLFIHFIARQLGGLTGDCYGATVEWTETTALLFIVFYGRFLA